MITETYVSELNENISIYGLIAFLGKITNKDNKLHLITPKHKLQFNLEKDTHKNKIELKLGKVHRNFSFSTLQNNVLNFGLPCTKTNKTLGEKRALSHEIVDNTVHILGSQNFDDYVHLNLVEITIDSNKIIETLSSYKKYKFRIIIESLLFSTNLQNNTDIIFITCDGLTEAKITLINSKLYKKLGVVYLSAIKDWNLIKNDSKRAQAVFLDCEYHLKASHFALAFTRINISDLLIFTITLLHGSSNKITLPSNETKVPTLNFKIQIVK